MRRLAAIWTVAAALAGCEKEMAAPEPVAGGNPQAGQKLIARYGCAACHEIKGIANAESKVGPPLKDIRDNSYVAGILPNTPDNMIRWIMHPQVVSPGTAMPELGVSAAEARDMTAYLYSQ